MPGHIGCIMLGHITRSVTADTIMAAVDQAIAAVITATIAQVVVMDAIGADVPRDG